MAELDLELLASIASGGLGRWVQDSAGQSVYVKNDDCIGAWAGQWRAPARAKAAGDSRRLSLPPACFAVAGNTALVLSPPLQSV